MSLHLFIEERLHAILRFRAVMSQVPLPGREVSLTSVKSLKLAYTLTETNSPLSKIVTLNHLKHVPKQEKTYCQLKNVGVKHPTCLSEPDWLKHIL